MVLTEDGAGGRSARSGSTGRRTRDGRVEVGYRVDRRTAAQGWRQRGGRGAVRLGARASTGCIRFRASVAPDNAASLAAMAPVRLSQTGEQMDEIDGEELVFELDDPEVARGSG